MDGQAGERKATGDHTRSRAVSESGSNCVNNSCTPIVPNTEASVPNERAAVASSPLIRLHIVSSTSEALRS
jgi:hypothetical protein